MKTLTLFLFATTLALAGCGKEKSQAPAASSATEAAGSAEGSADPAAADPAAPTEQAAAVEDEVDVPTEVDFEEDAIQTITDANLAEHVKAYEEELAQQ